MTMHQHTLPIDQPFPRQLARWLLDNATDESGELAGGLRGGLRGALVLLPSARAGATLQHALLEASGCDALLLPEITTPQRLLLSLADRFGLQWRTLPPTALRATLLSRQLGAPDFGPWRWHAQPERTDHTDRSSAGESADTGRFDDRASNAAGLADELLRLFDEARLHGLSGRLLNDTAPASAALRALEEAGAQELLTSDLARLRDAWRRYRRVVPRDEIDVECDVVEHLRLAADAGVDGACAFRLAVIAGFADMSPLTTELVRQIARTAPVHLLRADTEDPLSQLLLISYGDDTVDSDPRAPDRRLHAGLTELTGTTGFTGMTGSTSASAAITSRSPAARTPNTFRDRLAALGDAPDLLGPQGRVELVACSDPERESAVVAARVVEALAQHDGSARITVATSDTALAARIVAQLRDAGVDVDNTGGVPLAATLAGRLARDIVSCCVTRLLFAPLLEVLTHPFVDLQPGSGTHTAWTLRLEKMLRDPDGPRGGLPELAQRAAEYDSAARSAYQLFSPDMAAFVTAIARAFSPLSELCDRPVRSWSTLVGALQRVWANLVPAHPLEPGEVAAVGAGVPALACLLADLAGLASQGEDVLPAAPVDEFAGELSRMLAAHEVRPHRSAFLPVQVTGWLEARLEHCDLLFVAGVSEDVFPGRLSRPLFLSDRVRRGLGLSGWRENVALQSELFLRLLHGAERVVVSWPTEKAGQPCLPSPLVIRLGLCREDPFTAAGEPESYRREVPDHDGITRAQSAFTAEDHHIVLDPSARPLPRLSHSALKTYRQCPYRFLLERRFGLKEEEKVLAEFRAMDFGKLAHRCLQRWLEPAAAGQLALAGGDREGACRTLRQQIERVFAAGADDLPQRRLWGETLKNSTSAIVDFELTRARAWTPWLLEQDFSLPLGDLEDWLRRRCGELADRQDAGAVPALAEVPEVPAAQRDLPLYGVIDRIDLSNDSQSAVAVIDYKTGSSVPSIKQVAAGDDLQIILYALAVEAGHLGEIARPPTAVSLQVRQGAYYRLGAAGIGFDETHAHLETDTDAGQAALLNGARIILRSAIDAADRSRTHDLVPEFWANTVSGSLPCTRCPFLAVCRLEERPLPAHLEVMLRRQSTAGDRGTLA